MAEGKKRKVSEPETSEDGSAVQKIGSPQIQQQPLPQIQQQAPAFSQEALLPSKEFGRVSLSDYIGKWVVFFWYPLDFTFVCPTEIIAFGDREDEFSILNTQVIAASCDSKFSHLAWVNTKRCDGGLGNMKIPILADFDKSVAKSYGVLLPDGIPLRALFIISPTGQLRQITVNDLPVGRNVDEIIRLIKAFQFVDSHGEVCPANWKPGDLTMKADPVGSKEYFSAVTTSSAGGGGGVGAEASRIREIVAEEFDSIIAGGGLTVVEFWAPWCRTCKQLAPGVEQLAASAASVQFVTIDITKAESLSEDKGVSVLPTFQFYRAGRRVGEYKGDTLIGLQEAIRGLA